MLSNIILPAELEVSLIRDLPFNHTLPVEGAHRAERGVNLSWQSPRGWATLSSDATRRAPEAPFRRGNLG